MVEVKLGLRTVDLPFTVRLYGVTEKVFDELVDEDTKAELLDGVMIVHSPASPPHNRIGRFLRKLMGLYVEDKGLGEVFGPDDLIHLATGRRFAPDAFFLEQRHIPEPFPRDQFEGIPDLVIEVLSPSNRDDDLEDKRPAYRQAGVKEIWFVDPDGQQVIMDRRRKKTYATAIVNGGRVISAVLPGFWVETAWLWAEPPPKVIPCFRKILKG
jgi:Uma2 family endonuclease